MPTSMFVMLTSDNVQIKMRRYLLNILAGISLVLCVLMLAISVSSYWGFNRLIADIPFEPGTGLYVANGSLVIQGYGSGAASSRYLMSDSMTGFANSNWDAFIAYGSTVRLGAPRHPVGEIVMWSVNLRAWFLCLVFGVCTGWFVLNRWQCGSWQRNADATAATMRYHQP